MKQLSRYIVSVRQNIWYQRSITDAEMTVAMNVLKENLGENISKVAFKSSSSCCCQYLLF